MGKRPASDLKFSSAELMNVYDKGDIPYKQHYLVATPTKIRAYQ